MNRWIVTLCLVTFCLAGTTTSAAVVSRDWKTPGDGLLTYDDVNQREWLDLSQTRLTSQFPGATQENRLQYVRSQFSSGGLFEGFSVAESSAVAGLAQSAGIDTATEDSATNLNATLALQALLSFTYQSPNGNQYAVGVVDELGAPPTSPRLSAILFTSFDLLAGLRIADWNGFQAPSPPGVMLFRMVPEPSTICLGVALSGWLVHVLHRRH